MFECCVFCINWNMVLSVVSFNFFGNGLIYFESQLKFDWLTNKAQPIILLNAKSKQLIKWQGTHKDIVKHQRLSMFGFFFPNKKKESLSIPACKFRSSNEIQLLEGM